MASLGVAATAAVLGRRGPAVAAGLIWAALTGRFALKRLRGTSRAPGHVAEMVATSMRAGAIA